MRRTSRSAISCSSNASSSRLPGQPSRSDCSHRSSASRLIVGSLSSVSIRLAAAGGVAARAHACATSSRRRSRPASGNSTFTLGQHARAGRKQRGQRDAGRATGRARSTARVRRPVAPHARRRPTRAGRRSSCRPRVRLSAARQPLPGLAVDRAREHRVAQHPAREGAGLALERGDQVPVVDVARMALAVAVRCSADARARTGRRASTRCARRTGAPSGAAR